MTNTQNLKTITPDTVLEDLLNGNQRYISGKTIRRDLQKEVAATSQVQHPKAVILGCIDARVPIEYIFDQGVGDLFVVRVAGNIEDEVILGSVEYGINVIGSKLLMVLGHEDCLAVKSAINEIKISNNVTKLLKKIEPAIHHTCHLKNKEPKIYLNAVIKNNVLQTVKELKEKSELISNLEKEGKIKVIGAYYSVTDGEVTILQ